MNELDEMLNQRWSNSACMGYAIIAMESLSYPPEKIREAVREIDAAKDAFDLEEAMRRYNNSPY